MNIFGIGGWEILLIAVIALVVAGPKRLAQWAYILGTWTAKLRGMWAEVADSLQQELNESGIDIQVPRTPPTRADLQRSLADYGKQLSESAGNPKAELDAIRDEVKGVGKQVQADVEDINRRVSSKADATPNNSKNDVDLGSWGGA